MNKNKLTGEKSVSSTNNIDKMKSKIYDKLRLSSEKLAWFQTVLIFDCLTSISQAIIIFYVIFHQTISKFYVIYTYT